MKLSLEGGLQKIYGLEGGLGLKGGYETLRGVTKLDDTVCVEVSSRPRSIIFN